MLLEDYVSAERLSIYNYVLKLKLGEELVSEKLSSIFSAAFRIFKLSYLLRSGFLA